MKLQEAINIFRKSRPNKKIINAYEFDSVFMFYAVNKNTEVVGDIFFDSQISVNKSNGKVQTFQPWDIPIEEYKRGKKVI